MSKYRVTSGPYFPVFGLNTGKYVPEITPYLETFHAVEDILDTEFTLELNAGQSKNIHAIFGILFEYLIYNI